MFDGDDGIPKIVIYGNIVSCPNTIAVMKSFNEIAAKTDGLKVFSFDVKDNSAEDIVTALERDSISSKIIVQREMENDEIGILHNGLYERTIRKSGSTSYMLPLVIYVDGSGNVTEYTTAYLSKTEIINRVKKLGIEISNGDNGSSGGDSSDNGSQNNGSQINLLLQYGQTEARTITEMINSMRISSTDAWYWSEDNTTKVNAGSLGKLTYDYDLEAVAMKRAAEVALAYSHERPNGTSCFTVYDELNVSHGALGENIAAGYSVAADVNKGWREDDKDFSGQGHRRNMLSSKFNSVGIGHVYYKNVHYWVEEFAYRDTINDTYKEARNGIEIVPISVLNARITEVYGEFDKTEYSLKTGEISEFGVVSTIKYKDHWGTSIVVADIPEITLSDASVARLSGNKIEGIKEGTAKLQISLYGKTGDSNAQVIVKEIKAATGISLDKTELELVQGKKKTLTAVLEPKDAEAELEWSSDNENVAMVNENGEVTAISEGQAFIKVMDKANAAVNAICKITVVKERIDETPTVVPTMSPTASAAPAPKGTILTDTDGAYYKVTNSNKKNPTVSFYRANGMKKGVATIPETVTIKSVSYRVTSIADKAFFNNKKVTKVTVGNNVVSIGYRAFSGCTKLTTVIIGKNVKTIKKQAFYGSGKLKAITVKTTKLTAKTVGSKAFTGIYKKAVIKVPKAKYSAYKKLLKTKGAVKSIKYKKN